MLGRSHVEAATGGARMANEVNRQAGLEDEDGGDVERGRKGEGAARAGSQSRASRMGLGVRNEGRAVGLGSTSGTDGRTEENAADESGVGTEGLA